MLCTCEHRNTPLESRDLVTKNLFQSKRGSSKGALLAVEIDNFQHVLIGFGFTAADALVDAVMKRLETLSKDRGRVTYLGGNKFYLTLDQFENEHEAQVYALDCLKRIKEGMVLDGKSSVVTACVGIAVFPQHGDTIGKLFQSADAALLEAKQEKIDNHRFYEKVMIKPLSERLTIERNLRLICESGFEEFRLTFQPIQNTVTEEWVGLEAFLGWDCQDNGFLRARDFIHIADELDLLVDLQEWVLENVCLNLKAWISDPETKIDSENFFVAVNVTLSHFCDERFVPYLKRVIKKHGVDSNLIQLELSGGFSKNPEFLHKNIESVKKLGVGISLDDYGLNCSPLYPVIRAPIDYLKLNTEFSRFLVDDNDALMVLASLVRVSQVNNFEIIVTGLESKDQVKNLIGIEPNVLGQGKYFCKQLDAVDILEKLRVFGRSSSSGVRNDHE